MIKEFGPRADIVAAQCRVLAAQNACKNYKAHLRINITVEDVLNSRLLAWPLRLLHMCPESNGACVIIFAAEKIAKKRRKRVWVKDTVTVHREEVLDFLFVRGGRIPNFLEFFKGLFNPVHTRV